MMEAEYERQNYKMYFFVYSYFSLFASSRWFSLGTPVSSTNKTDCQDITEILLKVASNTINQTIHYCQCSIHVQILNPMLTRQILSYSCIFFIIRSNVFNYHPNVQCVWELTEIKIGCCSGI